MTAALKVTIKVPAMRRTRFLFCAIGAVLSLVEVEGRQTSPLVPLPEPLRTHVSGEPIQLVTSVRGLPLGVRDALQKLFASPTLDIAEPGGEFQGSGTRSNPGLPSRRLVAAGCSRDHCFVYYERAGAVPAWRIVLMHWTPDLTRFEWGGAAPAGLKTIDEVRKAVLSGKITGSTTPAATTAGF